MSILPMYRTCIHCGCTYNYDPFVGDFGRTCPLCGRVQTPRVPIPPMHTPMKTRWDILRRRRN